MTSPLTPSRLVRTAFAGFAATVMSATALPVAAIAQDVNGEIRFTWWGATTRNQKTEDIISLFESENPGATIIREPGEWGSYWDRLTVQSASRNQPCAITMQSRWLAQYADPAILLPLDDLVASGALDVSGIEPAVLDSGRGPDGNLYFIPHGVFYFTLLFNRTMIEEAGLSMPPTDWSWEDYAAFIRDLAPNLSEGSYASGNLGPDMNAFTNWVQAHGDTLFNADDTLGFSRDTVIGFFDFWEALRQEGIIEPADQMVERPDHVTENTLLALGRIAVDARPANQLDAHQRVLDTAAPGQEVVLHPYPLGPAGAGDDIGSNGLAISAHCSEANTEVAIAWMNFFLQDERAADIYLSDNGVVTVDRFQERQLAEAETAGQRQLIEVFGEVAPRARPAYYPAGGYAALLESLTSAYESVAFGRASSENAADAMLNQVERLMRD